MSRVIKFRAFNTKSKKMYQNVQDTYDYLTDVPESSFSDLLDQDEIWKVMQYTGLKDKNGKEIYEGDILEYSFYKPDSNDPKHGIVMFDKYTGFYLHNIWMFDFIVRNGPEMWKNQKIIGNIFENKELLND